MYWIYVVRSMIVLNMQFNAILFFEMYNRLAFVDSSAAERQEKRVPTASEEGPEDRQCHWRWKLLIQVHFEKASLFIDPVPIRSMEIRTSTSSFVVYGMIVGERKRNRKPSIT